MVYFHTKNPNFGVPTYIKRAGDRVARWYIFIPKISIFECLGMGMYQNVENSEDALAA
jgi:hypothetical protein